MENITKNLKNFDHFKTILIHWLFSDLKKKRNGESREGYKFDQTNILLLRTLRSDLIIYFEFVFFYFEFTYLKLKEAIFEGVPQAIITLISLLDSQYRDILTKDINDLILISISFLFSFSMIVITISEIDSESFKTFENNEYGNDVSRGSKDYNGLKKGFILRICLRFFEINFFLFLWVFLFYISWELCFLWIFLQILFYSFLYNFTTYKPDLIKYDSHVSKNLPDIDEYYAKEFDENSNNFYKNINFDRSLLFQNDVTNIILSLLLQTTLFKHSKSSKNITFWTLFYTKLNFIPYFSILYSNPDYLGDILIWDKYTKCMRLNTEIVECYFVKKVYYFLRFFISFCMYVSGIIFFFIFKTESVEILIFISIWLICNFILFWIVFHSINNDFSKEFKAFGAFNSVNAMQTENVDMAWELISLGEPTNIVIQDVQNRMFLHFRIILCWSFKRCETS